MTGIVRLQGGHAQLACGLFDRPCLRHQSENRLVDQFTALLVTRRNHHIECHRRAFRFSRLLDSIKPRHGGFKLLTKGVG